MFMSDPEFDDEFSGSPGFEYGQAFPSPDSKQRQTENRPPMNRPTYDDGGLGTPQNSRARMLAQQREIQLKKRQSNMQSGGMVRSSLDSGMGSPMRQSTDSQFTPAVRQFSAPKATAKDPSFDASPEKGSEFTNRPKTGSSLQAKQQSASRYSSRHAGGGASDDDEDGDRALQAARRADQRHRDRDRDRDRGEKQDRQDRHRSSGTGTGTGTRRGRHSDEEEEEDFPGDRRSYGGRTQLAQAQGSRNQDEYSTGGNGRGRGHGGYEDDRDRDRDRERASYSRDKDRDRERDRDRDRDRDRESTGHGRGWTGASGGRDVSQTQSQSQSQSQTQSQYRGADQQPTSSGAQAVPLVQALPAPAGSSALSVPVPIVAPDLSDMRAFLTSPLPKNVGTLQCYIRRNKSGTNKLFPIYSLYLKEGDVFLMASKKRPKNKTSNYLISMDQNDLHRTGRNYLGKLRSNFMGTEFQVFDNGVNPRDTDPDEGTNGSNAVRCELGAVMYAANVLGSRGPRKMQVALPGLDQEGNILHWKDTGGAGEGEGNTATGTGTGSGEDILTRMKDRNLRDLTYLINKPPRWNEQVGAYVLNFNGRVTMASVKNFQLVDPDEQNAVVLQFGRVGKDEFTMDLQHPISPFQAFAVTLSSFDSKIACD